MDTFEQHLHLPVTKIDDAEHMLGLLKACAPVPAGRDSSLLHHCRVLCKAACLPCACACMSCEAGVLTFAATLITCVRATPLWSHPCSPFVETGASALKQVWQCRA